MFRINIYIETTVKGPAKRDGAYGCIIEYKGKEIHTREHFGELKETTHNQLSLKALLQSITILNAPCNITVFTDNNYIANAIKNDWITSWSANDWKTAKGQEIKDKTMWQKLNIYLNVHTLDFTIEKSHEYSEWINTEIKRRTTT